MPPSDSRSAAGNAARAGECQRYHARAVPRTGRNDPCHCGSGKKYKNCCYDKDRERLQQSSEVAGLTRKELRASPERHLTQERLERATIWIAPRSTWNDLGYNDDLEDAWFFTMWAAVRAGRKDIGDRLMKLREPPVSQRTSCA